ncbi:hypothetical protein D6827_00410 [Candidatus Parcubacteria bacterium]|nr:MAG: hypothetical protein D6827_00410 [Candidatus Parcubacteria bacterium]
MQTKVIAGKTYLEVTNVELTTTTYNASDIDAFLSSKGITQGHMAELDANGRIKSLRIPLNKQINASRLLGELNSAYTPTQSTMDVEAASGKRERAQQILNDIINDSTLLAQLKAALGL